MVARSKNLGVQRVLVNARAKFLLGRSKFEEGAVDLSLPTAINKAQRSGNTHSCANSRTSLEELVLNFEGDWIRQALESSGAV